MMRAAIVHYHLAPGGVTRVIESACVALAATGIRHVILTGPGRSKEQKTTRADHRVIPGLGYLTQQGELDFYSLTDQLRKAANDMLGGPPDVWHFHNHSLGKNVILPHVVNRLATDGEAILLQIHDLAEHGRPGNYPVIAGVRELYPFSSRIRFAFINTRDRDQFIEAGLPPENAVILPNPIPTISLPQSGPSVDAPPLLFAPVRGIRRKNLGELVLLSALAPPGARIGISRAPENPTTLPIHENWRKFAAKHGLAIGFDVVDRFAPGPGAKADFHSWVEHATHFITTSVEEGFCMTIPEAIACGKPLIGRRLQHLTTDFSKLGIEPGILYDSILVPVDWVDLALLRDHLTVDLERDHRFYQRRLAPETFEAALGSMVRDGLIDFGNLPEPLQQGIIERLANPSTRGVALATTGETVRPLIDWLAEALSRRTPTAAPDQLGPFSIGSYQSSVTEIYRQLVEARPSGIHHVSPDVLLTNLFQPENFHFLLSSLRPDPPSAKRFRAAIFDVYGTLLIAPAGRIKPDPLTDPVLREALRNFGHEPPASPSTLLHEAVSRHHAKAGVPYPEIDLRVLWREILSLDSDEDVTPLVRAIEEVWHPSRPMPGAGNLIRQLARSGVSIGILSNAQCNMLDDLGNIADLLAPELTLLSYQQGIAKPSPELYQTMQERLSGRGISPQETLFIGNDPRQDIIPAANAGFQTALFIGHPDSLRPGDCRPDITFSKWSDLLEYF
jgi:FMN phosphatase YigB (HAD superfamily)/glycosyltransferase involved in cell wall biosynthesis